MENLFNSISQINPVYVYILLGGVAFIENIFPPFPSDLIVVAIGSLSAAGGVDFGWSLAIASVASTLGFMTMFQIGSWFGRRIIDEGRLRFLPTDQIVKVEHWFQRYGAWIVVANRFLAGTRAVVSFFVGMSDLRLLPTALLSFVSSLVWNFILLSGGRALGSNWRHIALYLDAYARTITAIIIVAAAAYILYRVFRRQPRRKKDAST